LYSETGNLSTYNIIIIKMTKSALSLLITCLLGCEISLLTAQTVDMSGQLTSTSTNLVAQPIPDRTVSFEVSDIGEQKPIIWGLDLAWLSEANILRGLG
jgi:hypothetical protein